MTMKFLGWSTRASQSGHPDPIMKKSRTELSPKFTRARRILCIPVVTHSCVSVGRTSSSHTDERPTNGEEFSRHSESQLFYPARRDRVRIFVRIQGALLFSYTPSRRRSFSDERSIWTYSTRMCGWNLYRIVLCICWKFVEQVSSGVSTAFKGNAWFSIEVTVTCPFAGLHVCVKFYAKSSFEL